MFKRHTKRYQTDLFNQDTFDKPFLRDLRNCRESLIIESPFIRSKRVEALIPILSKLRRRGVKVTINTRNPIEHDDEYRLQAEQSIEMFQALDIQVLYTVRHHRKLAIIDREIIWEGSLNILSYYDSCEIMRRTASAYDAERLIKFIGLQKYLQRVS